MGGLNRNGRLDAKTTLGTEEPVTLYCLTAMIAEGAGRAGFSDFSQALESAMVVFLRGMSREQQSEALCMSHAAALTQAGTSLPSPRVAQSKLNRPTVARHKPLRRCARVN